MFLEGLVRRFQRQPVGSDPALRVTTHESLAVANVEPLRFEMARAGRRYHGGNSIIANGIAPVAAIPTTTATLALFNGEADGGRLIVIDRIGFWLGSGTAAAGATLFGAVSLGKLATAVSAMATGYAVGRADGQAADSAAKFGSAVTMPTGTVWSQLCSSFQAAAANVGQGDTVTDLDGGLILRPGYALGLGILSGSGTTPLYGISVHWSELEQE